MNTIRIKGYNAEGYQVEIEGTDFQLVLADVSRYRLKPTPPENPDQSYTHLIESVIACEHVNKDNTTTIAIDFYRAFYVNPSTNTVNFESPVWRYYLNGEAEIAEFEAQSGLKVAELPVRKNPDGLTVDQFKRQQGKAYKFEIAVPTPFAIIATTHFTGRTKSDGKPEKKIYRRFAVPKTVDNANYEDTSTPAGDTAPPPAQKQSQPPEKPAPSVDKSRPQSPQPPTRLQDVQPPTPPAWYEVVDTMCLSHLGVQLEQVAIWMAEARIIDNPNSIWGLQQSAVIHHIREWLVASKTQVYAYGIEVRPRPKQPTAKILHVDFGFGRANIYSREKFIAAGVMTEEDCKTFGDYSYEENPFLIQIKKTKDGKYYEVAAVAPYPAYESENEG